MSLFVRVIFGGLLLAAGAGVAGSASPARAAATPAAADPAGRHLAEATTGTREVAWDVLDPKVHITTFAGEGTLTLNHLRELLAGQVIVSARTYPGVPKRAASAVAADATHGAQLPARLLSLLMPANPQQLVELDATVEQWIRIALQPGAGEQVCLVVLWQADQGPTDAALWFMLAKGRKDEAGRTRFSLIRVGSADDVLTAAARAQ